VVPLRHFVEQEHQLRRRARAGIGFHVLVDERDEVHRVGRHREHRPEARVADRRIDVGLEEVLVRVGLQQRRQNAVIRMVRIRERDDGLEIRPALAACPRRVDYVLQREVAHYERRLGRWRRLTRRRQRADKRPTAPPIYGTRIHVERQRTCEEREQQPGTRADLAEIEAEPGDGEFRGWNVHERRAGILGRRAARAGGLLGRIAG
jgi:hypothetical protein